MSDVEAWLDAERAHQHPKLMGAIADALLHQDDPIVVPGPVLSSLADRVYATGTRHGDDWASVEDAKVLPQWLTKGLEQHEGEVPEVSEGALPVEGVAQVVSWKDLRL